MGRKPKVIELRNEQRIELEKGYRTGSGTFSRRCHMVLLKSEGRSSKEIAGIVGTNLVSVNTWVNRYEIADIGGLKPVLVVDASPFWMSKQMLKK